MFIPYYKDYLNEPKLSTNKKKEYSMIVCRRMGKKVKYNNRQHEISGTQRVITFLIHFIKVQKYVKYSTMIYVTHSGRVVFIGIFLG